MHGRVLVYVLHRVALGVYGLSCAAPAALSRVEVMPGVMLRHLLRLRSRRSRRHGRRLDLQLLHL